MRRITSSRAFALTPLVVVLALAMPILASGCEPALTPTADYQFSGSRKACGNDAPALTDLGTNTFKTESVDGKSWKVLDFPLHHGLQLTPTAQVVGNGTYTIVLLFRLDDPDGYRRLLDFNGSAYSGFFEVNEEVQLYPQTAGGTGIGTTFVQVAVTRSSSGQFTAYIDGRKAFAYADGSSRYGVITNNVLKFFKNTKSDGVTGDGSGAVARIRLFDKVLTGDQIKGLGELPASPCSTS
jgi:hypothetical protein